MMTPKEMIAVIAAFEQKKPLQRKRPADPESKWDDFLGCPTQFDYYVFRVKPEPRVFYANTYNLGYPSGAYIRTSEADALEHQRTVRDTSTIRLIEDLSYVPGKSNGAPARDADSRYDEQCIQRAHNKGTRVEYWDRGANKWQPTSVPKGCLLHFDRYRYRIAPDANGKSDITPESERLAIQEALDRGEKLEFFCTPTQKWVKSDLTAGEIPLFDIVHYRIAKTTSKKPVSKKRNRK